MAASSRKGKVWQHSQALRPYEMAGGVSVDETALAAAAPVVSKSQRKRDAHALQELGKRLVALPATRLARLGLPDTLRDAVLAVQGMHQHGARLRQMQYIGKLMRQLDATELHLVHEALDPSRSGLTPPRP